MKKFDRETLKQIFVEVLRPLTRHIQGQLQVIDEIYGNLNNLADAINEIDGTGGETSLAYNEETKYLSMVTNRAVTYDSTNKLIRLS